MSWVSCSLIVLAENYPYDRLIALWYQSTDRMQPFNIYTGHLYTQILGQAIYMMFIQDRTKLSYYSPDLDLRMWNIADLIAEHWHTYTTMYDRWMANGLE